MPYLSWIDNSALESAVLHVYQKLQKALADRTLAKLQKNKVDPFALLFETHLSSQTITGWVDGEGYRQWQKSMANAIGEFHQIVLGNCYGWQDLGIGDDLKLDIKKKDNSAFAEIKNKYNTMNDNSAGAVFLSMQSAAAANPAATIYLVEMITASGKPIDTIWKKKGVSNDRIRRISGDRFYALVTGKPNALEELFVVLPKVIDTVLQKNPKLVLQKSSAVTELNTTTNLETSAVLRYFFSSAFPTFQKDK